MKKVVFPVALLIIVAAAFGGVYAYLAMRGRIDIQNVQYAEVRDYQGAKLSSINDFIENSIKGPQHVDPKTYRLKVTGLVAQPQELTYDQVLSKYPSSKKVVALDCVEGWNVTILWEGIHLRDLFADAKPTSDAKTVIFHAVDGYTTSFPISYFKDNDILMAYKMNGVVLPPEEGFPFYLVAESKWGYKWIKWIDEIQFSSDENYKGYWESRGYSESGDLNKPF